MMLDSEKMKESAHFIKSKIGSFIPHLGIILGSGLGHVANEIKNAVTLHYCDVPGFPQPHIQGHAGRIIIGELNNLPVICLSGRTHYYENPTPNNSKTLIRTLKLLGCQELLLTNSAGSLRHEVGPGSLSLITDHINFSFHNPLAGPNEHDFGPRFVNMINAYDPGLNELLLKSAEEIKLTLAQGVYLGVLGPSFETPAEIRTFKTLGADLVGMSTIPEVIIARHCDLKTAAISVITNHAAGMSDEEITHEKTLQYASIAANNLCKLITCFAGKLKSIKE